MNTSSRPARPGGHPVLPESTRTAEEVYRADALRAAFADGIALVQARFSRDPALARAFAEGCSAAAEDLGTGE